jgi:hypothetical protein
MLVGASAQKLMTRNGYVKFFSDATLEDIEAENNQVSSVIDLSNGNFAFVAPIKGFQFEKALMQEHFNENYMESGTYPNGTFKGTIEGYEKLDLSKDGTYNLKMSGIMNIHGQDQKIVQVVKFTVNGGKLNLNANFNLRPADYGIEIPASKKDNIADTLELTVKMSYEAK